MVANSVSHQTRNVRMGNVKIQDYQKYRFGLRLDWDFFRFLPIFTNLVQTFHILTFLILTPMTSMAVDLVYWTFHGHWSGKLWMCFSRLYICMFFFKIIHTSITVSLWKYTCAGLLAVFDAKISYSGLVGMGNEFFTMKR